jgi:hypothetical protein
MSSYSAPRVAYVLFLSFSFLRIAEQHLIQEWSIVVYFDACFLVIFSYFLSEKRLLLHVWVPDKRDKYF